MLQLINDLYSLVNSQCVVVGTTGGTAGGSVEFSVTVLGAPFNVTAEYCDDL